MNTKKTLYIISILIIIVSIYFLISKNSSKSDLPNCVRFYSDNIITTIRYPDDFLVSSKVGLELYYRNQKDEYKKGRAPVLLSIDLDYFQSVDDIIKFSLIDPGPKYKKSMFNGYEAAFSRSESEQYPISNYYRIPFGNKVIAIDYQLPTGSNEIYEKMLRSISFMQTNEDIKEPRVERCDK